MIFSRLPRSGCCPGFLLLVLLALTILPVTAAPASPALSIATAASLPTGVEGLAYGPVAFAATGGTGPYTWSATGLAYGLTMSPAGVLSGTPGSGSGSTGTFPNYTPQVTVTDASGSTVSATFQLLVRAPLGISPPVFSPTTDAAILFSYTVVVTGGIPPYGFSATGLPPNVSISAAGVISGTPPASAAGSWTASVSVKDSAGGVATQSIGIGINPQLTISGPKSLAAGMEGASYGPVLFTYAGGTPNYWLSVTGLPGGLSLTNTGWIIGIPAVGSHGTYSVQFTVRDAVTSVSSTLPLTIQVPPTLNITAPSSLPTATEGTSYGPIAFTAAGGTPPYQWGVLSPNTPPMVGATNPAALPSGLTISSGGVLSGTPAAGSAQAYGILAVVLDSAGNLSSAQMTLVVQPRPLLITSPAALAPGTENAAYGPVTFTATGGSGSYRWSAGYLPSGLSFSTGGVLSGTPAGASHGQYNAQIGVTDARGTTTTSTLPLTILPPTPPGIAGPTQLNGCTEMVACAAQLFTATGGAPPYTFSATGLPSGMTVASNGLIGGTPAAGSHGTYNMPVTVQDSVMESATKYYLLVVSQPLAMAGPSTLPAATVGQSYGPITFQATGGFPAAYIWQLASGALPAGLGLSLAGVLSGTPAPGSAGTAGFTLQVYDGVSTVKAPYTLTVQAATATLGIVSPLSLPSGAELNPYGPVTFTATGGTGGYTWSATGLPPGLTMSSAGVLSGSPGLFVAGAYTVVATVHDSSGSAATLSLPLTMHTAPALAAPFPPAIAEVGVPYGPFTLNIGGGVAPYTFTALSGIPAGIALTAAGVLSGTPAPGSQGSYNPMVRVTDSLGNTATGGFNIAVSPDPSPLSITGPAALPNGSENAAYGPVAFATSGGSGTLSWSATGLPAGLTMSAAGVLSGTPATGSHGSYGVNTAVHDANGRTAAQALPLTINTGALAVGPATLPAGMVGVAYGPATLTASGGTAPYIWAVSSGLPSGLALSPGGILSGTPTAASGGTYMLAVTVHDAAAASSTASWTLNIQTSTLSIAPAASLPAGREGLPYSQVTFTASGGSGSGYTWSAAGMPAGLSMSAGGVLSGTPALGSHGAYTVQLTVRDSSLNTASASAALTVYGIPALAFQPPLPPAQVGKAYSFTLTASAGMPPYTWSVVGSLPGGLALSAAGLLTGTPAAGSAGSYSLVITVADAQSYGFTTSVGLAIAASASSPAIATPAALPAGIELVSYAGAPFTATGGTGGYTWSATGLPSGLNMYTTASGSGAVTGTPAAGSRGTYNVAVTVRDSSGAAASLTLTLTIQSAQSLAIASPLALGPCTELSPCAAGPFTASGGTAPYSWSASGLPAGLTLSPAGQWSGTPGAGSHGSYTVQLTIQDASRLTATLSLPLLVNAPVRITGPATLPAAKAGAAYGPVQITETGGTAPLTWSLNGALAPGLAIDINGVLSGTPAPGSAGTYAITVQLHDFVGSPATWPLSLTVEAPLVVAAPAALPGAAELVPYGPVNFTAAGGAGGYFWSAAGLPAGLAMAATGALSGTPAVGSHGSYPARFTVADASGSTAAVSFTLAVAAKAASVLAIGCTPATGPVQAGVAYSASCTASGGTPPYSFSLSGGLPAGLSFDPQSGAVSGVPAAAGTFSYAIQAVDSGSPAQTASQSYAGSVAALAFSVTPGSLSFAWQPGSPVAAQTLSVSPGGFPFTVALSATACPWFQASPMSGNSPAQIAVTANPAGLNPGTYNCGLGVTAGGSVQNVFLTLTVAGATLTASPSALTFSATVGGGAASPQTIAIDSASHLPVAFTAVSSCSWMTVTQGSTSTPSTLSIAVQPAGLAASTYNCPIAITAPSASQTPQPAVSLRVNPAGLQVGPSSISLNATEGSSVPLAGSLSLTGPDAAVAFSASVTAGTGGNWLSLTAAGGSTPANLGFQANPYGLAAGTYSATVHVISSGVDTPVPATLTVAAVTLREVPSTLAFHFQQGSQPAAQVVSVLASDSSTPAFAFQTGGHIAAASGPGAGNVSVSVAPGLGAGTYADGFLAVVSGASGARQVVPVTIVVDAPPPAPILTVSTASLAFSFVQGTPAAAQLLLATNQGAAWTPSASVSTSSGGAWLALSPLPASAADGTAVAISVTADPSQAPGGGAGVYSGEVVVSNAATGQAVHVPVSMTVNPLSGILLSRQGLSFTAAQAGGDVPGDTLDLVNLGLGNLTWTATASTRSGGGWLQVAQASGTCGAGSSAGVGVSVNTAALATLAPGSYYGWVEVRAFDATSGQEAANSPQTAAVVLNVLAPATQMGPSVRPAALIFSGNAAQTVTIYNSNSTPLNYTSAAVTADGSPWCTVSPAAGTVAGSATLAVQAALAGLGAGVHGCTVQISFADGSSQSVAALAVVSSTGGLAAAAVGEAPRASKCAASGLVVALREPAPRTTLMAFQPAAVEVQVTDGCGNPVDGAATSVAFSTGDGTIAANSVGGGIYRASWTPTSVPRNVPAADIAIQAAAQSVASSGSAQPVHVTELWNATHPVLISPGGIVDAASSLSATQVAPCGWIAIFGENLADGESLAGSAPLPLELQGTSVFLGGRPLPLRYVSAGQIDAQIPCGIQPNSRQDLVVVHGSAQTLPSSVVVATAQPAIFTANQQGIGQASAFWTTPGGSYLAADAANPVPAGGVIEIYCTGLGPVAPAVAEGTVSPSSPLAWSTLAASVTIGGQPATVLFAGLVPGAVGIYQVNAVIPAGAPAGASIPVGITVDGHTSQPGATIAVR